MSDLLLIIWQGHQQQPFFSCSRPTVFFSLIESLIETLKNHPETMRSLLKFGQQKEFLLLEVFSPLETILAPTGTRKGRQVVNANVLLIFKTQTHSSYDQKVWHSHTKTWAERERERVRGKKGKKSSALIKTAILRKEKHVPGVRGWNNQPWGQRGMNVWHPTSAVTGAGQWVEHLYKW